MYNLYDCVKNKLMKFCVKNKLMMFKRIQRKMRDKKKIIKIL